MSDKADLPLEPEVHQPGLKFLEAAVYIMGGLLVLMLLGLVGGIIYKIANKSVAPPPEAKLLDLGSIAVQDMQLDGDRLAIRTATEIIIVDFRKNTVLSRIGVAPK